MLSSRSPPLETRAPRRVRCAVIDDDGDDTHTPTHATTVGDGRPRPCGHGTVHQAPPSRMLAGCGLLRHRQAAVPLPPLQRRRVVCCVLRAACGALCAALGALLRLRACTLQPRARAPPRSAALVERVVFLVLGQRGDDSLLGRPAIPGSAGRRGWAGEAGLGRGRRRGRGGAGPERRVSGELAARSPLLCSTLLYYTLLYSALLYCALGGSLAEEVALRHLDDLLALVRDPHLVTTGLGLGLALGSRSGPQSSPRREVLTVIGRSLVCVAVTSADGKTFLTKRVAASRSWCPPSL